MHISAVHRQNSAVIPRLELIHRLKAGRMFWSANRTSVRSMSAGAVSDREEILATVARWEQAQAEMADLSFSTLTGPEVLGIQKRVEIGYRSQSAVDHKLMSQLTSQCTPTELGAKSWAKVLSEALRISEGEAK